MITFTLPSSSSSSSSNSSLSSNLWHHRDPSPFRFNYRQFSEITTEVSSAEPAPSTSVECSSNVKQIEKKKFKKRVRNFFGRLFKDWKDADTDELSSDFSFIQRILIRLIVVLFHPKVNRRFVLQVKMQDRDGSMSIVLSYERPQINQNGISAEKWIKRKTIVNFFLDSIFKTWFYFDNFNFCSFHSTNHKKEIPCRRRKSIKSSASKIVSFANLCKFIFSIFKFRSLSWIIKKVVVDETFSISSLHHRTQTGPMWKIF